VTLADLDAIAVTAGPGLIGGVLSGVMLAKGLGRGDRAAADRASTTWPATR
jgi:tRNA A37 threonylcarbamoyltransferase TsaD